MLVAFQLHTYYLYYLVPVFIVAGLLHFQHLSNRSHGDYAFDFWPLFVALFWILFIFAYCFVVALLQLHFSTQ